MILSVSRRTDIPAFFSDWFYNRIEKGFVYVQNPFNIHQINKISIKADIVDCIVFWTKNPKPFIGRLNLLNDYSYYFQYTITGYGKKLEPNVPYLDDSIEYFTKLSKIIGFKRVIWRYDPIIFTDEQDINFHLLHFEKIAQKLAGKTERCVISFVDYYKKTIKNLSTIKYYEPSKSQILDLAHIIKTIGSKYNIDIVSCAEEIDLSNQGISRGQCIDDKLIKEIFGISLNVEKDKNQRQECGCVASIDIGAYNTCPHGCLYCYANYNLNQVRRNYSQHNVHSELLFGTVSQNDKITEKRVLSCKVLQGVLFDSPITKGK
jgi:hypothetical protein